MRVGSAPTPATYWKPLLSGCGKQKSSGEGKGEELFPLTDKTEFESLSSLSTSQLQPRPQWSSHWGEPVPRSPLSASNGAYPALAGCSSCPQCGHFYLPSSAPDHAVWAWTHRLTASGMLSGSDMAAKACFLPARPCKMFSIEPKTGAISPS